MFHSNQIFRISRENSDIHSIDKLIHFCFSLSGENICNIRGMKEKNGHLIFGWIPKESNGSLDKDYVKEWDTTFLEAKDDSGTILVKDENDNIEILSDIIHKWLDNQTETYKKLFDENDCRYWDTPTEGFEFIGADGVTTIGEDEEGFIVYTPFSTLFIIKPFWAEFAK